MDRKECAKDLYKKGYSCAQAVVCAYQDEFGISEDELYRISEGLGGGMGHYGSVCGACSAMVLVLGARNSRGCKDQSSKSETYAMVKDCVERFEQSNTYVNCDDILANKPLDMDGEKRVCCVKCIELACDLLDENKKGE